MTHWENIYEFWLLGITITISFLVTRVLMKSLAWLSCGEWCPPCINFFVIITEVRLRMHGFATSCFVKTKQQSPVSQARVQRNQVTSIALLHAPFSLLPQYSALLCSLLWCMMTTAHEIHMSMFCILVSNSTTDAPVSSEISFAAETSFGVTGRASETNFKITYSSSCSIWELDRRRHKIVTKNNYTITTILTAVDFAIAYKPASWAKALWEPMQEYSNPLGIWNKLSQVHFHLLYELPIGFAEKPKCTPWHTVML